MHVHHMPRSIHKTVASKPTESLGIQCTFKAFLEVGLDSGGVLSLRQNLQHLIIGQEEEAGKCNPLDLQVGCQALLDVLQQPVVLYQPCQPFLVACNAQAAWQLRCALHHLTPQVVHLLWLTCQA